MPPVNPVRPTARAVIFGALALACHALATGAAASSAPTGPSRESPHVATASSGGIVTLLDLSYPPPPGGDPAMARVDIHYLPDGGPKRWMVFVHGGSWVGGDKSNLQSASGIVPWFVARDYAVAAVNFRLASPPGGPLLISYAEQASDIAHALAWLAAEAATYEVTASAPLLFGYSSGAHLVALLAADGAYLGSAGMPSNHLYAAISFDVHAYDVPYALQLMQGSQIANNIPLIEHLFGTTPAEQLAGSPSAFVGSGAVAPSLLVSADPPAVVGSKGYIAAETSRRHRDLLQAAGVAASWSHFDQETHQSLVMNFGAAGDAPTEAVETFLDGLDATIAVGDAPHGAAIALSAPTPNPFGASALVRFTLPRDAEVSLEVLDVSGRRIRHLVAGEHRLAGTHTAVWDGRDDTGQPGVSGIFFVCLRVGAETRVERIVRLTP